MLIFFKRFYNLGIGRMVSWFDVKMSLLIMLMIMINL